LRGGVLATLALPLLRCGRCSLLVFNAFIAFFLQSVDELTSINSLHCHSIFPRLLFMISCNPFSRDGVRLAYQISLSHCLAGRSAPRPFLLSSVRFPSRVDQDVNPGDFFPPTDPVYLFGRVCSLLPPSGQLPFLKSRSKRTFHFFPSGVLSAPDSDPLSIVTSVLPALTLKSPNG